MTLEVAMSRGLRRGRIGALVVAPMAHRLKEAFKIGLRRYTETERQRRKRVASTKVLLSLRKIATSVVNSQLGADLVAVVTWSIRSSCASWFHRRFDSIQNMVMQVFLVIKCIWGALKDCWLTTMVSAPMPLGSSV